MFLRKKIIVTLKLQNYKILLFRVTIHGDGNVVPIRNITISQMRRACIIVILYYSNVEKNNYSNKLVTIVGGVYAEWLIDDKNVM